MLDSSTTLPTPPARVALVAMPFGAVDRPSLGISLLKAALVQRGIACDIHYLSFLFAARITLPLYDSLSVLDGRRQRGEQLFAREVFGNALPDNGSQGKPLNQWDLEKSLWDGAEVWHRLCDSTGPFLETCLESIPWEQYQVIGFSTTFEQNMASLALAQRLKARWPHKVIVFGGANCEGEMGLELHRQFECIDIVCSGEGDVVFPPLVEKLLAGEPPPRLPGLLYRVNGQTRVSAPSALPVTDLDRLPHPIFDDYFQQIDRANFSPKVDSLLPFESSRGCWYGARQHCTFCGLNGATMAYRSKSPARMLAELRYLVERYGVRQFSATDNILDMQYMQSVLPELAQSDLGLSIHYEIKANLNYEQLKLLKQAGVDRLQPGIESLSTPILKLMRKGVTALQNIQLLKWASEFGIHIAWNFLGGFPGEDPHEYERMAGMLPALVHLEPPQGFGFIRMDRFSPYFNEAEEYGLTNKRAAAGYALVYPFEAEVVERLAYYFEYDFADGRNPAHYAAPVIEAVNYWRSHYCVFGFTLSVAGEKLILRDRRPQATNEISILTGAERAVYDFLYSTHPFKAIQSHLESLGHQVEATTLQNWLTAWVEQGWIVKEGDWYLSLAVPMNELL